MVSKKLKIVQILPELDEGGVECETIEIAKYLQKKGHKSYVISEEGRLLKNLKETKSTHINWAVGKKNPLTIKYFFPLRNFLLQKKIDIIHARSRVPAWLTYLVWKSMKKKNRPRFITTFHGFYSVSKSSAIMSKGEKIISISNQITSHIKENYGIKESKIQLIYRGVDEEKFNPKTIDIKKINDLKKKWSLKNIDSTILAFPARITRLKGHLFFLEAINLIKDLNFIALFIGSFEEKSSYSKEVKAKINNLQIENKIKFVGNCNDMPSALMLSDIVLAPSILPEAFGRVAIEAGAMEKPIIATKHGGSLETILEGKTGLLVEPNNTKEFAKALKKLILNKKLQKALGQKGRKQVIKNFTNETMCKKTIETYQSLCAKNFY